MPVDIEDVSVFTDPVTAPDDGDFANGATIQDPIQDLANRTKYLKDRTDALYGNDPVALEGPLELNDENVTVGEDLAVGGDLTVTGGVNSATLTSSGILSVGGASTLTGNVSASAISYLTQLRVSTRVGPDADTTITVGGLLGQFIHVPTTTTSRTYTISQTGAQDGDFFAIRNDSANILVVTGAAPGDSVSLDPGEWVVMVRIDGTWQRFLKGDL